MHMSMKRKWIAGLLLGLSASLGVVDDQAAAMNRRDEQDAARRAMLNGQVMPFSVIRRRMEREMRDADYLGSEFNENTNRYRLKYVREGRVMWVDVDGRTGEVTGWAR